MTVENDMDSFFRSVRDEPEVAIKKIKSDNSLVMSVWKGDPGLIIGSTPLHWASHDGHLELVKLLVQLGAEINSDNADWWCRPIDWAVDSAQYEVAEYLIKNGASLSGDKWSNCTPLHVVAQGGSSNGSEKKEAYIKTAEILINAGAVVNAQLRNTADNHRR